MKLYDNPKALNPRRVTIFLAEKGIDVPREVVSLADREQVSEDFAAINPSRKIPVLELDDGTLIPESVAICRYFEELHPEPNLMGRGAKEAAEVESWQRLVEMNLFLPAMFAFQNCTDVFAYRMNPVQEWGEECRKQSAAFYDVLNERLSEREFIVAGRFTIADITALCGIDFNQRANNIDLTDAHPHLQRWHQQVSARPSV